ncbi:efflux transporter, RND family, MFP subunit [Luminiphilus syltensis NOR5-1B]|uniref:Efflux transporter, RND family, MFP subunit n=2 Tax=Luminiphilus TaxID=1341118 RepID=B8KSZ8_9GAMM|nr:efflux transporter, RND family, MFP subunit [Luminiphilus syltensis NOR5-1B]
MVLVLKRGVVMTNLLKRLALPGLVLCAGAGIYLALQATKPVPEEKGAELRGTAVFVTPAVAEVAQLTVETQGNVRPRFSAELVAQVSGRVVSVSPEFIEGGRFLPEEPLLSIEDTDFVLALDEAKARLAGAQVELEQALADADVARKQLAGQSNPSPLALKKPQVAQARASLKAAEAALSLAQTNLERTRLSLPFAGRIASTEVDLGQFVTAGTRVGTAFGTDRVEVRLPMTDSQLAALGVPIGFSAGDSEDGFPVDFSARVAGETHHWTGWVRRLDAFIDPTTRTVFATAEVDKPYDAGGAASDMPLAIGLFVDARIAGRMVEDAIRIPAAGLRAGDQVYVLNKEGRLEIRDASVVYLNSEGAILEDGVLAGEMIVTSAIRNAIPGMKLELISDSEEQPVGDESFLGQKG